MEHNDGGPAFPAAARFDAEAEQWDCEPHFTGMSLRDYFAAKAMQALVGAVYRPDTQLEVKSELQLAEQAYTFADAMLAVREPKEPA